MSLIIYGQSVRISYDLGSGSYNLGRVRSLQAEALREARVLDAKAVVQFPDYINHTVSLGLYLDKNNIFGINVAYLTTGGRNQVSDYTGEYKLDMIVNGYQYGIESEHIFNLNSRFDLSTNFKLGVIKSTLDVSEYLVIYNLDSRTTTDNYSETNYFLEPNLDLSYKIMNGIALKLGLGFNLNTTGFDHKMIDWSGVRTRAGISYSL